MRTDSPQSPRAPEPTPRRSAAAGAATAATPGAAKPGAPNCAFAAMLLAADAGHEAQAPLPQADTEAGPDPELAQGKTGDAATPEPARLNPAESATFMARLETQGKAQATEAAALQDAPAAPTAPTTTAAAASTESPAGRKAAASQAPAAWVSTLARARATAGAAAAGMAGAPSGPAAALKPAELLAATTSAHLLAAAGPLAAAVLRFAAPLAAPAAAATQSAWASADATGLADEPGAAVAAFSASARADTGSREGSGQGTRGGDAAPTWVDAQAASTGTSEAAVAGTEFGQLFEQQATGQGLEAVLEPLNQQISLWLAGQVKRANLVLQEGLGQPLEIGLQLDGNQARLDFQTNDAALLETLQAQAPEALSEMLGQNGLELVGLSIGSRASGQSDRSAQPRPEWAPARSERSEPAEAAASAPTLQIKPSAGRAGLSVYA